MAIAGDAVKSVLVQRSIGNIEPRGLGSLMPVASNDTEEGREKNRRVEAWVFAQR